MTTAILGIISSVLLIIIGLWKYCGRKNEAKRKLAEDAQKELDDAQKNKDKSSLLDAWTDAGRMR